MNWFTCIVYVGPGHVSPVQYFFTRAASAADAVKRAKAWFADGEPGVSLEDLDVPLVFRGRHERCVIDDEPAESALAARRPAPDAGDNDQRRKE